MLNNPPINELEQKAGCRYLLVSAVAKQARKLMLENHNKESKDCISDNVALDKSIDDFYAGKYTVVQNEKTNE